MSRKVLLSWIAVAVVVGAAITALVVNRARDAIRFPSALAAPPSGTSENLQVRFAFGYGEGDQALGNPVAVLADSEAVYVSDGQKGRVAVFTRDGTPVRSIGAPGSAPGHFLFPYGLALRNGTLYVADMGAGTILMFDANGGFAGNFTEAGVLSKPTAMVWHGQELIVADAGLHQVLVLSAAGSVVRRVGSPGEAEGQLRFPNGIALSDDGTMFVSDSGNDRIAVFNADGSFRKSITGNPDNGPLTALRGIALDQTGSLYVVVGLLNTIVTFDPSGTERSRITGSSGSPNALYLPNGIFLDSAGWLYVTESGNRRISVFH